MVRWIRKKFKKERHDGYSDFFVLILSGTDVIFTDKRFKIDFVHRIFFVQCQINLNFILSQSNLSFREAGVGLHSIITNNNFFYGVKDKKLVIKNC